MLFFSFKENEPFFYPCPLVLVLCVRFENFVMTGEDHQNKQIYNRLNGVNQPSEFPIGEKDGEKNLVEGNT